MLLPLLLLLLPLTLLGHCRDVQRACSRCC
jgi:hypothetical protein